MSKDTATEKEQNIGGTAHRTHHNWKVHLSNLPNVKLIPDWQGENNFACIVIPVFSFDASTKFIEEYIAKTAAWCLKTWKENSDAFLFDVPFYLYVEKEVADVAVPILTENKVPKNHIKVAEYSDTAWLAKCLQPIFEKEFRKFEYIIISDIDMFPITNDNGKKLPLVNNVKTFKPKGMGCKIFHETIPIYWMPRMKQLYEYKNGKNRFKGDLVTKWVEVISALADTDLSQHITGGKNDFRPWTGCMVVETQAFRQTDWLSIASQSLGDDEAVMYAWSKVSSENKLWDLGDMQIDCFVDMMQYVHASYAAHSDMRVRKSYKLNDIEFKDISFEEPCLLHHFASLDYKFYKTIGAY